MNPQLLVASILVILGIINSYKLHESIKLLMSMPKELNTDSEFVLLIPVLDEQSAVPKAISRLDKISYPAKKLKIVFITTAKEKKIPNIPTTKQVLRKILPSDKGFISLHYPHASGVKADQLNWAIRKLEKENRIKRDTIIGVYDIDSAFSPNSLQLVSKTVIDTNANVFQQPSLYFRNWKHLSWLAKSSALYQTTYGFYYEIPMWRNSQKTFGPMIYCNGHGMFVRHSFLKRVGYFPTPIEDTRFGHFCAFVGERVELIPLLDDCETTPSLSQRIKQASVWFSGDVQYLSAYKDSEKLGRLSLIKCVWLVTSKTYRTLVWMFQGFLLFLPFIIWKPFLLLFICIYFMLPPLELWRSKSTISVLSGSSNELKLPFISIILLPISALAKSISPWYAIYRYLKSLLLKQPFLYPKTERQ